MTGDIAIANIFAQSHGGQVAGAAGQHVLGAGGRVRGPRDGAVQGVEGEGVARHGGAPLQEPGQVSSSCLQGYDDMIVMYKCANILDQSSGNV